MKKTEFESFQFSMAYPDGVENNYWTLARNRIILRAINSLNLGNRKVLEIGCGKGLVVEYLRKNNINIFGVELANIKVNDELKKYISTNSDFKTINFELSKEYEVILLLDVIEHIHNVTNFIKEIMAKFPNLKYFIITVPARKEIWSNYDEYYGHFRRYDLKMLSKDLESLENKVIFKSYFFHLLYFPALIMKLFGIDRPVRIVSPEYGFAIIMHKVIYWFLIIDYYIFPRFFPGSSILMISRPK